MNNPFEKKSSFSAARHETLSQDFTNLVNNPKDNDIQFRVVDSYTVKESGETIYNESTATNLYAHSTILRRRSRYFATMLDEDKNWKTSKGVIYISDTSSNTFRSILDYIYTGNIYATEAVDLINLITAAIKMNLPELSSECQARIIRIVKYTFSNNGEASEECINLLSIEEAFPKYIIPVLNISDPKDLSRNFFPELFKILLPHISKISTIPDIYTKFINDISSDGLLRILSSDYLGLEESSVWDLTLSWACNKTNLSKTTVETRLKDTSTLEYNKNEETSNKTIKNIKTGSEDSTVSISQLCHLKEVLAPFLPAMRFSLLEAKDYARIVYMVNYFLPHHRSVKLQEFFLDQSYKGKLEEQRMTAKYLSSSTIITESAWELLRKNIFEAGVIDGCDSLKDLKFELLFRASEHKFSARTFYERCDEKGPTLTLIRSEDGYLFGGVNFINWNGSGLYAFYKQNFLFALPDRYHRKDFIIFRMNQNQTIYNYKCPSGYSMGPTFGTNDLCIADAANSNKKSCSQLPSAYDGDKASKTTLAGSPQFQVSDYEVFAISNECGDQYKNILWRRQSRSGW